MPITSVRPVLCRICSRASASLPGSMNSIPIPFIRPKTGSSVRIGDRARSSSDEAFRQSLERKTCEALKPPTVARSISSTKTPG